MIVSPSVDCLVKKRGFPSDGSLGRADPILTCFTIWKVGLGFALYRHGRK